MHTREALAAYREGELEALCAVCGQDGVQTACPRCQAPLCEAHAVTGDERCASCEEALEAFVQDRKANPLPFWLYGIGLTASAAVLFVSLRWLTDAGISAFWALSLAFVGGFLPLIVGRYRLRRVRRVFLEETPRSRRLEVPAPKLNDAPVVEPPYSQRGLASDGLVLACLVPLPFMPLLGIIVCLVALLKFDEGTGEERGATAEGRHRAMQGVTIGIVCTTCQLIAGIATFLS